MHDRYATCICASQSYSRKNYGLELIGRPCGCHARRHASRKSLGNAAPAQRA